MPTTINRAFYLGNHGNAKFLKIPRTAKKEPAGRKGRRALVLLGLASCDYLVQATEAVVLNESRDSSW